MTANYNNMEHQRKMLIRNHLKDMFVTYDTDIVESVLLQRDWNVDRAVDDLMAMSSGCSFDVPVEDGEDSKLTKIQSTKNSEDLEEMQTLICEHDSLRQTTVRNYEDDDVIVLYEEEFNLPIESDEESKLENGEVQSDTNNKDDDVVLGSPPIKSVSPMDNTSSPLLPKPTVSYVAITQKTNLLKPPPIVFTGYTSYNLIKKTRDSIERVKLYVQSGFKVMVILRGCPGSGKSTIAKKILSICNINHNPFFYIHSSDNFFSLNSRGVYNYDPHRINEAHKWNQVNVLHLVREGLTPIIIDNTNIKLWEMKPYVSMAVCAGYEIEVIEPDTTWAFKPNILASRTLHKVPEDKIRLMLNYYNHNVSSSTLLKQFHLDYSQRTFPPQKGSKTLKNQYLKDLFDNLYKTVCLLPARVKEMETQGKATKSERKRFRKGEKERKKAEKRKKEDEALTRGFVELEELPEANSMDSLVDMAVDAAETTHDESEDSPFLESGSENSKTSSNEDDEVFSEFESEDSVSSNSENLVKSVANTSSEIISVFPKTYRDNETNSNVEVSVIETDRCKALELTNNLFNTSVTARPRLKCFENFQNKEGNLKFDDSEHMLNAQSSSVSQDNVIIHDDMLNNLLIGSTRTNLSNMTPILTQVLDNEESTPVFQNNENLSSVIDNNYSASAPSVMSHDLPSISCEDETALLNAQNIALSVTRDLQIDQLDDMLNTDLELASASEGALKTKDIADVFASVVANDSLPVKSSPINENEEFSVENDLAPENSAHLRDFIVTGSSSKEIANIGILSNVSSWDNETKRGRLPTDIFTTPYPYTHKALDFKLPLNILNGDKKSKSCNFENPWEITDTNDLLNEELNAVSRSLESDIVNSDKNLKISNITNQSEVTYEKDLVSDDVTEHMSPCSVGTFDSKFPINNLVGDIKSKSCNTENLSEFGNTLSEAACSYGLQDDLINMTMKNVISNDLWGQGTKNKQQVDQLGNEEKELSDDSENSDSRSNSSSSEKILITDLHNTLNRFVNNDIKGEKGAERKKVNLDKKNLILGDSVENESSVSELNTLKEILINNFKHSSREYSSDDLDSPELDQRERKSNIPRRKSSTAFNIIENKLKDENSKDPVLVERNEPTCNRVDESCDDPSDKYLIQWLHGGGSWDDSPNDVENKRSDMECKPPRRMQASPSKQKNSETASIRIVNDIRNASDNSKISLLHEKNKFQESSQNTFKSSNVPKRENSANSLTFNSMLETPSKEKRIKSDFEAKFRDFRCKEEKETGNYQIINRLNSTYPNFFKEGLLNRITDVGTSWNTDETSKYVESPDESVDNRLSPRNLKNKKSVNSEIDDLTARFINLSKDENTSDFEKGSLKWPLDQNSLQTVEKSKTNDLVENKSSNYFLPGESLILEQNKWTNTGKEDSTSELKYKMGHCREINQGRKSPDMTSIESSYGCEKSTMTEGDCYTLKAKPKLEDMSNLFPLDVAEGILELYEKCSGNMDWIIEILMEDGHSPSDDQLEYLSSLQNVVEYKKMEHESMVREKDDKGKKGVPKKRNRNRNSKNNRQAEPNDLVFSSKKDTNLPSDKAHRDDVYTYSEDGDDSPEMTPQKHIPLFLDLSTVSQLIENYGNPTIYSVKDYQPVVNIPEILARQLHAYLIGSVIDQAEENEEFINRMIEEDNFISSEIQNINEELSQNDVTEMENSLTDFFKDSSEACTSFGIPSGDFVSESTGDVRSQDSFASKLSLNLLLRAFPTISSSFVKNTFREQNFSYYPTKNVLTQYGKEIPSESSSTPENNFEDVESTKPLGIQLPKPVSSSEVSQTVHEYRRNAAENHRKWQKCHESLTSAIQKKKLGVAAYYREMMNVFKQKYDENNAHAAAILVDSCCLQNSDMIDLHYFKVADALLALDKFLDYHIKKLDSTNRPRTTLYIITGRGARSMNGMSRLQPPVKNRLKRRNINFEIEPCNTGLVKATVRRNSFMSCDL